MAIPIGARGTTTATPSPRNRPATVTRSQVTRSRRENPALMYIPYGSMPQPQQPRGPGGSTFNPGGSSGGGGPSAYDKFLIAEEQRKRKELEQRKAALTKQLQGARSQALPLLRRYHSEFGNQLNTVFGQNRALNKGYSNQLAQIAQQLQQQMGGQQASLQQDLAGQGAGGPDIQALLAAAQQANQGTNFLNQNAQMYNTRLAQAMALAEADARAGGGAVLASSRGNLENAYAQALAQIGMIGLT